MNENNVNQTGDDVTPQELFALLPNSSSAFEAEYTSDFTNYTEFYDKVYDNRNSKPLYPYRYGTYQVYQASRGD